MKITLKKTVEEYLLAEPRARERKNRAKAVWHILKIIHPSMVEINKSLFETDVFTDIQSINRLIVLLQKQNSELRGNDYYDKTVYEQQAQIDLGYEPRYHYDVKKLKSL